MNQPEVDEEALKFRIPSGMIVSGPSGSGKTSFVRKLLSQNSHMFAPKPQEIIYCYGEFGSHIPELEREGIRTHAETPNEELLRSAKRPFILVIDDMMLNIDESWLNALFTKKAHHGNFSIIFLTQNMFDRKLRVARQNSQYLVLMKARNFINQVHNLGQQLFPGKISQFMECYSETTKQPFNYLVVDLHPLTDPQLCLRSNIFPDELTTVFSL